jgi:hypothetical protein
MDVVDAGDESNVNFGRYVLLAVFSINAVVLLFVNIG